MKDGERGNERAVSRGMKDGIEQKGRGREGGGGGGALGNRITLNE